MSDSERTTSWVPLAVAAALALAAFLYTIFAPDGLLRWFQLREEVAQLSAENESLREENARLRTEARKLRSDKPTLERAVRQELGYTKSDEMVFKFPVENTRDTGGTP